MHGLHNNVALLRLKNSINHFLALSNQAFLDHQDIDCHNNSNNKIEHCFYHIDDAGRNLNQISPCLR